MEIDLLPDRELSKNARMIVEAHDRGYRVLVDGQVVAPHGNTRATHPDTRGYYSFTVKPLLGGCARRVCVHQLAAYQKYGYGAFSCGVETRHLDGNKANNALGNIAIGTHHDNIMDMPAAARQAKAQLAASRKRKLTTEQACALRTDHALGMSYTVLAEKYGVKQCSISYIVNGKTYRSPSSSTTASISSAAARDGGCSLRP